MNYPKVIRQRYIRGALFTLPEPARHTSHSNRPIGSSHPSVF
jgi:hypothetical protein